MKKFTLLIRKFLNFIFGFFKKMPGKWLFYGDFGPVIPKPPSRPQDEPIFAEETEERVLGAPRERVKCYRDYSEFLAFLAEGYIDGKLPVGSTFYVPRKLYVDHHLQRRPGSNPKSYYNGPIKRELHNHQYFVRHGISFSQQLVQTTQAKPPYEANEMLFELTRRT